MNFCQISWKDFKPDKRAASVPTATVRQLKLISMYFRYIEADKNHLWRILRPLAETAEKQKEGREEEEMKQLRGNQAMVPDYPGMTWQTRNTD